MLCLTRTALVNKLASSGPVHLAAPCLINRINTVSIVIELYAGSFTTQCSVLFALQANITTRLSKLGRIQPRQLISQNEWQIRTINALMRSHSEFRWSWQFQRYMKWRNDCAWRYLGALWESEDNRFPDRVNSWGSLTAKVLSWSRIAVLQWSR